MYILNFPIAGEKWIFSLISLMPSILRLLAASISIKSIAVPSLIDWQRSHWLSGSPLFGDVQFSAFARILAVLVLPVPLGPQNKYA